MEEKHMDTEHGTSVRILFEDASVLVVYKPAGLAAESAGVTDRDLESLLRLHLAENGEDAGVLRMIHRLDRPVEGILVFAKTGSAAAALSKDLRAGRLKKTYRALVGGTVPKERDTLTDWLVRDRKNRCAKVVSGPGKNGTKGPDAPKKAVLHYRRTGENELSIEIENGRFHQIRAQLAHAGMPILGDRLYGGENSRADCGGRAIALCADSLSFRHPVSGEEMAFEIVPRLSKKPNGRDEKI